MTQSRHSLEDAIAKFQTVERGECRDCGNRWWFDMPDSWVCTTCSKGHGKSQSSGPCGECKGTGNVQIGFQRFEQCEDCEGSGRTVLNHD